MQERFAVRTTWSDPSSDKLLFKTTIAEGRPQAVIHAERIGQIDDADRPRIREFLEGGKLVGEHLCVTSSGGKAWTGVATIYLITD